MLLINCLQKAVSQNTQLCGNNSTESTVLVAIKIWLDKNKPEATLLLFATQSKLLMTLKKKAFENIVRKGENAGNQHFILFPQCFLPFPNQISIFESHNFCCLQMPSTWTDKKMLLFGKELNMNSKLLDFPL